MRRLLLITAVALVTLSLGPASAGAVTVFNAKSFSAQEGQQIRGQSIVGFDDAGACAPANYTVTVDWGDGSTSPIAIPKAIVSSPGNCSYDARGDHTYARTGQYSVTATICLGATCTTTPTAGVANISQAPLKGEAAGQTATAGRAFTGQIAELKDDNQLSHATDFAASVDWGDGTPPSTATLSGDAGKYTIDGGHTYAAPGGYRLAVTVSHDGTTFLLDPATVTVNPGPATTPTTPATPATTAPTATVRILGGAVTLTRLQRNGLRLRIGVSNTRVGRLSVRLRDSRTGRTLWTKRIALGTSQVRNGQRSADVRVRIPKAILKRLRRGRSYGLTFPRQSGLPSFGTAFRLR